VEQDTARPLVTRQRHSEQARARRRRKRDITGHEPPVYYEMAMIMAL
jgi:hypothetical protein